VSSKPAVVSVHIADEVFTVRFGNSLVWSNVHLMTAVVCACLPTYTPLWKKTALFLSRVVSYYISNVSQGTNLPSFIRRSRRGGRENPPQIPTLAPLSTFGTVISEGSMTGVGQKSECDTIEKSVSIREIARNDTIV
jgi:hypothetical protein